MPRLTKPLSDTEIKQSKPKASEYGLSDGNGLILRIRPTGSKTWMLNYIRPHVKTRTNFTLGSYPEVSLALARKKALQARELLAQDIDPKLERDQQAAAKAALIEHTFERVAADWFAIKKDTAEVILEYLKQWKSIEPRIGQCMKTMLKITRNIGKYQGKAKAIHDLRIYTEIKVRLVQPLHGALKKQVKFGGTYFNQVTDWKECNVVGAV